jgi:hypothetical protein
MPALWRNCSLTRNCAKVCVEALNGGFSSWAVLDIAHCSASCSLAVQVGTIGLLLSGELFDENWAEELSENAGAAVGRTDEIASDFLSGVKSNQLREGELFQVRTLHGAEQHVLPP